MKIVMFRPQEKTKSNRYKIGGQCFSFLLAEKNRGKRNRENLVVGRRVERFRRSKLPVNGCSQIPLRHLNHKLKINN